MTRSHLKNCHAKSPSRKEEGIKYSFDAFASLRETIFSSMRWRILLSFLVLIICESSLFAQNKYDLSQFGHESSDFIKQPGKWDGGDWLKLGVMSGAAFLTMQVDQPIRDAVLKDRSYFYSVPIEAARMYGELYSPVVFFIGFAGHSLITNNMSSRKIAYEIGQASLYTGAITLILKTAFGRSRPFMNEGTSTFRPFSSFLDRYHSFPGGHTATAFVISTVLSRNVHPTWLKILVYLPAVITPISRVYQDQHWMSDNVFGGALGYFVAKWVADVHDVKDKQVLSTSSTQLFNISFVIN
jgi:membrane-associated phospholipid phosphatase